MRIKDAFLALLLGVLLVSCASQSPRDKDAAVDEALGAEDYETQADEAQKVFQDAQAERRKEQQNYLERQITDPTV